ncbi:riboflavin biosynthesis protein RibF [Wolbachia endosymbiont of Atemnus politus]|uniref:riboflavin biosynthesis protein RibF n=1 Tax=Wolbachia endosymbiont of Atemnus politus TaxID=2682840 RepID=UPI00157481DE|nr:riboflavin biosynthesis protein RibF [Wolbachia endosymbiont of Atemnus politus]NSM56434.1 riboflavin biosynthesis protein RibF [Wolbachia endosymbiont of Atemnus politus]NSX83208.1 riboflavin biosynthesis protein RibF [Wolbachia endosymbiont of Atemnus politus]
MKIVYDFDQGIENNVALTFGNFDGVHLGHGFAISTLKRTAQERRLPSAILTFEPHPLTILSNRNNFRLINQERKKELISSYGIDYLYSIDFNKDFAQVSCDDFISNILIGRYNAKHIVVGESCTFGHKRLGNTLTLRKYSETYGYSLTRLEPLIIDGEICSSSSIREYLQKGEIEIANKLLGRPYQVSGVVTKGACRGREIGFPTINIPIEDCMIKPKFGTYYARALFLDSRVNWLYGVVNIGMRPTFKDLKRPIIEMHIFDFNKDVYNRKVNIQLLKFIRSEKRFHSIDELTKQINHDIFEAYQLRTDL